MRHTHINLHVSWFVISYSSCPVTHTNAFPQAMEDSPSGLWRTLGKRVGVTASRVRISYPPPDTPDAKHCKASGVFHKMRNGHWIWSLPKAIQQYASIEVPAWSCPAGRPLTPGIPGLSADYALAVRTFPPSCVTTHDGGNRHPTALPGINRARQRIRNDTAPNRSHTGSNPAL